MAKFNSSTTRVRGSSFIESEPTPSGLTNGGQPGFARDLKSELLLLAVTNLVGEQTYYESAGDRDDRYAALVRKAAITDPEWTVGLLGWLRGAANLRTAALVGAVEFVHARLTGGEPAHTEGLNRGVVNAVCRRADEPGELLAYWLSTHGRKIPMPIKRGLADAVVRLYDERAAIKWDSAARRLRFADVIELVHPQPRDIVQEQLFRWLLDSRHHNDDAVPGGLLCTIRANHTLRAEIVKHPEALLDAERLTTAGMTWEAALSLGGDLVDKAQLWAALIPSMGYMALLRNLRGFDEAALDDMVADMVAKRLADPGQVARSKQMPLRFLSAYRNVRSVRWHWPLEQALQASLANVPALDGHTLILVDRSGSMWAPLSERSQLDRADAAALFGTALAMRAKKATLVQFGWNSEELHLHSLGQSLLPALTRFGELGATWTAEAVRQHLLPEHTRVIIVTDEQTTWGGDPSALVPDKTPLWTINLAGYRYGHAASKPNRYVLGGLSDATFGIIPLVERGAVADWPWMS